MMGDWVTEVILRGWWLIVRRTVDGFGTSFVARWRRFCGRCVLMNVRMVMVLFLVVSVFVRQVFDQQQIGAGGGVVRRRGRRFFNADMVDIGVFAAGARPNTVRQTAGLRQEVGI